MAIAEDMHVIAYSNAWVECDFHHLQKQQDKCRGKQGL